MTALITFGTTGTRLAMETLVHGHIDELDAIVLDSCCSSVKRARRERIAVWRNRRNPALLYPKCLSLMEADSIEGEKANQKAGTLYILPYARRQTAGRARPYSACRDAQAVEELAEFWNCIAGRYDSVILAAVLGEMDSGGLAPLASLFRRKGVPTAVFAVRAREQNQNTLLLQQAVRNQQGDIFDAEMIRERNIGYFPEVNRVLMDDRQLAARCLLEQIILQRIIFRLNDNNRLILGTEELGLSPEDYPCREEESFVQLQVRGEGAEWFEDAIPEGKQHQYAAFPIGTVAANGYFASSGSVILNALENNYAALQRLIQKFCRVDLVVGDSLLNDEETAYRYVAMIRQICSEMQKPFRVLCVEVPAFCGREKLERFAALENQLKNDRTELFVICSTEYPASSGFFALQDTKRRLIRERLDRMEQIDSQI